MDYIVFNNPEPSYFSDRYGNMYVYTSKLNSEQTHSPYETVVGNGVMFYVDRFHSARLHFIPLYFVPNSFPTDFFLIHFHMNSDDVGHIFQQLQFFNDDIYGIRCNIILVEYPTYGTYESHSCSEQIMVDDAIYVYDFVKSYFKVEDRHIIVYGRSVGTGVSMQLASRRRPAALILCSPFKSIKALADHHLDSFGMNCLGSMVEQKFDSIGVNSLYDYTKLLIIHGKKDSLIPYKHGYDLHEKFGGKLILLDDYDHNNIPTVRILYHIKQFVYGEGVITTEGIVFNKIIDENLYKAKRITNYCNCCLISDNKHYKKTYKENKDQTKERVDSIAYYIENYTEYVGERIKSDTENVILMNAILIDNIKEFK